MKYRTSMLFLSPKGFPPEPPIISLLIFHMEYACRTYFKRFVNFSKVPAIKNIVFFARFTKRRRKPKRQIKIICVHLSLVETPTQRSVIAKQTFVFPYCSEAPMYNRTLLEISWPRSWEAERGWCFLFPTPVCACTFYPQVYYLKCCKQD